MGFGFGYGFGLMEYFFENIFPVIFVLMFGIILTVFITGIIKNMRQSAYNRSQPVLTVQASVTGKRESHSTYSSHGAGEHHHTHTHTSTTYYATFQVESGDRIEFSMDAAQYAELMQGDTGRLTFQGTAFKGFERARG